MRLSQVNVGQEVLGVCVLDDVCIMSEVHLLFSFMTMYSKYVFPTVCDIVTQVVLTTDVTQPYEIAALSGV